MGFAHGLVSGQGDRGQERLHAAEQRVSSGRRTTLCGKNGMREVSVANITDMVDKEQMVEEKSVSSIGHPMCQTFCDSIMVMRDADGVREVKFENLVERCVKHLEE